ncbi:MAG TPA: hypothetical protein VGL38_12400 [bacterium]
MNRLGTVLVLSVMALVLIGGCKPTPEQMAQKLFDEGKYEELLAKYPNTALGAEAKDKVAEKLFAEGKYDLVARDYADTRFGPQAKAHIPGTPSADSLLAKEAEQVNGIRLNAVKTEWAFDGTYLRPSIKLEAKNVTADRPIVGIYVAATFLNTGTHEVFGSGSENLQARSASALPPGYSVKGAVTCNAGFEPHLAPDNLPDITANLTVEVSEGKGASYRDHSFTMSVPISNKVMGKAWGKKK